MRSQQLAPLSREHEEGMAFVNRIRQGLKMKDLSLQRLRSYTCWYWKNHIRPHFFQEEKILMPFLPNHLDLGMKMKEDHGFIRDVVISLDHDSDRTLFEALCALITTHIAFEEKQVFAYLEQQLSESELNTILAQLNDHPVGSEEWPDKFWENSAGR